MKNNGWYVKLLRKPMRQPLLDPAIDAVQWGDHEWPLYVELAIIISHCPRRFHLILIDRKAPAALWIKSIRRKIATFSETRWRSYLHRQLPADPLFIQMITGFRRMVLSWIYLQRLTEPIVKLRVLWFAELVYAYYSNSLVHPTFHLVRVERTLNASGMCINLNKIFYIRAWTEYSLIWNSSASGSEWSVLLDWSDDPRGLLQFPSPWLIFFGRIKWPSWVKFLVDDGFLYTSFR